MPRLNEKRFNRLSTPKNTKNFLIDISLLYFVIKINIYYFIYALCVAISILKITSMLIAPIALTLVRLIAYAALHKIIYIDFIANH